MAAGPPVHFYLADRAHPVTDADPLAETPLPTARNGAEATPSTANRPVTYGAYFRAVRDALHHSLAGALVAACCERTGTPVDASQIRRIDVFLVKHGAFYHPCRVVPKIGVQGPELVLNGAVSENGRRLIAREYDCLHRLAPECGSPFIPKVYGLGTGSDGAGLQVPLFLGEWFPGFHECHLSRHPGDNGLRIRVWDGAENSYLTPSQANHFHRQCAAILTGCYNPLTFEQIFPWHHAAGDFIVSCRAGGIDVRLISVRGYQPLLRQPPDPSGETNAVSPENRILEGLTVYLPAMSLRMRIDRLDGVGKVAWAPDDSVAGAVCGYFEGLEAVCRHHGLPPELPVYMHHRLLRYGEAELAELCHASAAGFPLESEERRCVERQANAHAHSLRHALHEMRGAPASPPQTA